MAWQVRRPIVEDATRLATINVRGWQHAYAGLMPADLLASLEIEARALRLRDRLRTQTSADGYVVTDEHGTVAGYCWFGDYRHDEDAPDPAPAGDWAEIYAIYVDPDVVGTGAGSALMTAALADLDGRSVGLWVLEGNVTARRFYEHFGFRTDGVIADFDAGGTLVPEVRYLLHR